jgi:uncharacterized membrane protein
LKGIIKQLQQFIAAQKVSYWIFIFVLCAAGIYINYFAGLKQYLKSLSNFQSFVADSLLYTTFTVIAYLGYSITHGNYQFWKRPGFLVLLILGILIFAFRTSYTGHQQFIESVSQPEKALINKLTYNNLFKISYLLIPLSIIWFIAHRRQQPLYGMALKKQQLGIYFTLLACMLPLIIYASTLPDFLAYYPRAKRLVYEHATGVELLLYELCYGIDFIGIELFFRGFMIMAFAKYLGINSVLPIACFYLSIHFGKPMGEAISSFFGGAILGVISYHSRSIYGGVIIHMGIAWLMELGGFIGNWLTQNNQP